MVENLPVALIMFLAFGAVALVVFVIGQIITLQIRVQQRIAGPISDTQTGPTFSSSFDAFVATYFDEKRFGLAGTIRANLRRELMRAGFFHPNAIQYYVFARLVTAIVLPGVAYLATEQFMANHEWYLKLGLMIVAMLIAVAGPDAYIARRQRVLHQEYRIAFPDMLDLMVVCVDSGLSLEGALDRISPAILNQDRHLGNNLMMLGAEMRAGRSTVDALDSFADRLGLDEARSLVAMLRQSLELGTDVGDALRVFGDEMRDRRLLRAEEKANQLPVKMVAPLGLFIFPVILVLVMLPVGLRLFSALP